MRELEFQLEVKEMLLMQKRFTRKLREILEAFCQEKLEVGLDMITE